MDRRPYLVGTIVGAAVGGAIGYLWYTRGGPPSLERARHLMDRFSGEMQHAQSLWLKVRAALSDYQHERRRTTGYRVFDVVDLDSQAGLR